MSTSLSIPFDVVIKKAFELRETDPDISVDDILKEVLPNINIIINTDYNLNIRKKTTKDKVEEKKTTKKIISEEERCLARTVYEDKHLEHSSGILKIMRDDPRNLYGDRCKCRKKENSHFCTRHSGQQPLGIWNSKYCGKLFEMVQKTKKSKDGKEPHCEIIDSDLELDKKVSKKSLNHNKLDRKNLNTLQLDKFHTSLDDLDTIEAEPIIIDTIEYYIDNTNTVLTLDGDILGKYDKIQGKWIYREQEQPI
jgi:hypothetical protein